MSNGAHVNECIIFAHTRAVIFSGFHLISSQLPRRRTPRTRVLIPLLVFYLCINARANAVEKQTESHSAHAGWELGIKWKSPFSHCRREVFSIMRDTPFRDSKKLSLALQ